jgi:uncharacterized protein involved in outer membrane biogenesis
MEPGAAIADNRSMNVPAGTGLRRVARRALRGVAAFVLLALAGLAYILLIGISLDVSHRGRELAQRVSARLGREVRLEGPLALDISARPRLRVNGLVVANQPAFAGDEPLARLGELRLQLDLWWLLRGKVFIEELAGTDIELRLLARADGSNNWSFARAAPSAAPHAPSPSDGASPFAALARVLSLLDVGRVALERLSVRYTGADGATHQFNLASAEFHWLQGKPFTLSLRGSVEKTFPYAVDLTGGSLELLARGTVAWPFEAQLGFLGTAATFAGEIDGDHARVTFGLGSADQSEIERLLQIDLPRVGAVGISGELNYQPGRLSLARLDAAMGNTTLSGALEFDRSGARPRISGAVTLPALDLRPFITDRPDRSETPPKNFAELYRELARASFSLKALAAVDADLRLKVGRWTSLPGDVRDAALEVHVHGGRLRAPVRATIAGVELAGEAIADAARATPRFSLALGTSNSRLGGLAELLTGAQGVAGQLGRLDLRIEARGDSGAELVDSLDARFAIEDGHLSYGNVEGGRPVEFRLDRLVVAWPAGEALSGEARGSLLGRSIEVSLSGASLAALAREARTPLDFEVRAANVRAHVHGVVQTTTDDSGSELSFELTAAHAGEVAQWFGLVPGAEARFAMDGRLVARRNSWRLADFSLQLGRSRLEGEFAREQAEARPLTRLRLVADPIDIGELESLLPKAGERAPRKAARSSATLDIPILPQGVSLADADIDVQVKRIAGAPLAMQDISFNGRIREGAMQASRFAAQVADIAFKGTIAVDLRGTLPLASLSLAADAVDIGAVLQKLGLARDLQARLDRLRVQLTARASRLGDMLARSELQAQFEGGSLIWRDPNTKGEVRIALDRGLLSAAPSAPVGLSLIGAVDLEPVAIGVETAAVQELANPGLPFPFKLTVGAAGSALQLTGSIARPVGRRDIELLLDAGGARASDLDRVVHTSLPPWGPWSATGKFRMSQAGYRVDELRLQVAESVLKGHGALDTASGRPRLDVALEAPSLQLDDFRFGDWSPVPKKAAAEDKPRAEGGAKVAQKVDRLLARETLRRQDATITVDVGQVLSGKDRLGNGRLEAKLADGVATLGPAEVKLPGGDAKLSLVYEPVAGDVRMQLRMLVDHLDYGVLARRIDQASEQRGIVSLRVEVDSRAAYPSEMLRHGSGRIDFALWPENLKAGVFDLWAVNVLEALLPKMDPSSASKVNCAIGRFALADGKLNERTMLIDTSRIRVTGKGEADFGAETLDFRFEPRPKTAEFLSLAIPVEVKGSFSDYRIGVGAGDVVGGVARLATSIIAVPFERLFGKTLPANGEDVCSEPELFSGE